MTLRRPRHVTIDGQQYRYRLKHPSIRFKGQSPATLLLVVQLGPRNVVSTTFLSKHWQDEHEEGWMLPPHKAAFRPSDVCQVIRTLLERGSLPEAFELPDWKMVPPRRAGNPQLP